MSLNTSKRIASQREKFEQAAREAETDDREDAFDRVVKKIAAKPEVRVPKAPLKKSRNRSEP